MMHGTTNIKLRR